MIYFSGLLPFNPINEFVEFYSFVSLNVELDKSEKNHSKSLPKIIIKCIQQKNRKTQNRMEVVEYHSIKFFKNRIKYNVTINEFNNFSINYSLQIIFKYRWKTYKLFALFQLLTVYSHVVALPWPRIQKALSRLSMTKVALWIQQYSLLSLPMEMHYSQCMRLSVSQNLMESSSNATLNTVWDLANR